MRSLTVLSEAAVLEQLDASPEVVLRTVEDAYHAHWQAYTVCPHSLFLRFPERPRDRIIALPAYVRLPGAEAAGMKWISSFPGNTTQGLRRASALIVLNDLTNGYPRAVMEGSAVSAYRTGAGAALAARHLAPEFRTPRVAVVGAGRIAQSTLRFLLLIYPRLSSLVIFDVLEDRARQMADTIPADLCPSVAVESGLRKALKDADIAIFATTASTPHVTDPSDLGACRLVLHISLRDFSPEVLAACCNVVDDPEHVMRERTSLHLFQLAHPDMNVIAGSLGDFIWGGKTAPSGAPVIFSPFGLGVLDIALAQYVLDRSQNSSNRREIPNFFEA